ncbi:MAG TPA: cell envelope biogenesis protein TolA [Sphingomonas sp.]|uniref:cell envelope biogenesis protein TolA n=1 Tax=Sphingomonas sp. TaxID=28214 RepID=UPI002ED77177
MERSERAGLGIAIVAHAALLAVLSLGLLTPKPVPKPVSDTIDIQFADEVGLVSGAPDPASEAPATSQAPETGKPEEAAAAASEPTPAPPEPRPTPPPAPKPSPTPVKTPTPPAPPPKPKPVPKPTPTPKPVQKPAPKPAPAPAKPSPAKPTPAKPAPAKAAADRVTPAKAAPARSAPAKSAAGSASDSAAKTGAGSGRKTAGAALGDDFLKGISPEKSDSKTQAPRAATVSANQMAGLVGAIQRQLLPCADRRSSPGPGSNRIVTRMRLQFRKDGSLASAPTVLGQTGTDDENARYATRVGELAIGIARECSPLKLPPELYQVGNGQGWNDIVIRYKLPG